MIQVLKQTGTLPPIDAVIERYGARAVLIAALKALVRRKPRVSGELPDYLHRDVGLTPPETRADYWRYL